MNSAEIDTEVTTV